MAKNIDTVDVSLTKVIFTGPTGYATGGTGGSSRPADGQLWPR